MFYMSCYLIVLTASFFLCTMSLENGFNVLSACMSDEFDAYLVQVNLKGYIWDGIHRMVMYLEERCEQHSPSGSHPL